MTEYPWPGNIRELENIIERAVITAQGRTLKVDLPKLPNLHLEGGKTLEEIERDYIIQVLNRTQGKIAGPHGAAETLGMIPSTLRSRIKKLGINRSPIRYRDL
jgi:transcriptional regulator with GAF, ATPase, and Fis domain